MEYLTCDKLKDMRNIYICGFACMNILGNWPVVGLILCCWTNPLLLD